MTADEVNVRAVELTVLLNEAIVDMTTASLSAPSFGGRTCRSWKPRSRR